MACVIGIDLGTSSVRVVALDESGETVALQGREYSIRQPAAGFAEQSPAEWWSVTCECLRYVTEKVLKRGDRVAAVGLSGQMHGLVLLDAAGNPLRDAIIWPDARTAEICAEWDRSPGTAAVGAITGLPIATGFLAPSLAWVKRNEPDTYRRASRVVLPKDYIRFRLTGSIATDDSDASGTLLFDVRNRRWSEELTRRFGLEPALLPPVLSATDIAGEVSEEAARETGLAQGIPVAVGGSDQSMAAIALGVSRPGVVAVAISTGGTVITAAERPFLDRRVHTLCHCDRRLWILMGACLSAGLSLSWFARTIFGHTEGVYDLLSREAESVAPGSEGLLFAPYLCGDRTPYMDAAARGSFIGLSLRHGRGHMVRAIMEGVVFSLCESVDIFRELGLPVERILCSGGGSRSPVWRQIQADVFGMPVEWRSGDEHSAIGAAVTAGTAIGTTIPVIAGGIDARLTHPSDAAMAVYKRQRAIYKQIYPQNAAIFRELSQIAQVPASP
jgi:xylulokinase